MATAHYVQMTLLFSPDDLITALQTILEADPVLQVVSHIRCSSLAESIKKGVETHHNPISQTKFCRH